MDSPILFTGFNRLDTTQIVFNAILRVKPKKLYVAIDGPRNQKEFEKVQMVRTYVLDKIKQIDWECKIKTRFREKNLGVGSGVVDAIDWLFENEEKGIILEDDCLPNNSFFKFCNEMLDYFKANNRIGIIGGFNPFPEVSPDSSFFFSKYALCWGGWATWKDRWALHDMFTIDWPISRSTNFLMKFTNNQKKISSYWSLVFDAIYSKQNFSWDTRLNYAFFKTNKLSVVPKENIIDNIGYGSKEATNTYLSKPPYLAELTNNELEFPLVYPKNFIIINKWDGSIEKTLFNINYKTITRLIIGNFIRTNKLLRLFYPFISKIYKKYKIYFYKIKKI
jgi:hypothetical protein